MFVRFATLCLTGVLLASCSVGIESPQECSEATEFYPRLCLLKIPPIKKIAITENGAGTPSESDIRQGLASCEFFVMSEEQVREYLETARRTGDQSGYHDLSWSPCSASGNVEFSDGISGTWNINSQRDGSLQIKGQPEFIPLSCANCDFLPNIQ